MLRTLKHSALALAAFASLAAGRGEAQEVSISFAKHTRHGSFALTFGSPRGYDYAPRKAWVPGHYEVRCERVWVKGACQRVWHPPVYETRVSYCGKTYQVCVEPGWWESVEAPGHYETRRFEVWVPGHWRPC